MMSVRLRHVMLLLRDLQSGIRFYGQEGLGLTVRFASERMAELDTGPGHSPIVLRVVDREADRSTGYSPFLSFDVDDMNETVSRLLSQGGTLDGPIKYPAHGKVAAVRSPDGHMISLYERNTLS